MGPPADGLSIRSTLYRLEEITLPLASGGQIGPISWVLERGSRTRVACASEAQWNALVALLTGEATPATGRLEEVVQVRVQTDTRLRETLDPNRSLDDYLNIPDVPGQIALDGRRHSLLVLVDALGITPGLRRRALKFAAPELTVKAWALRFMLSRASLLIGREIFRIEDPLVRAALRRRWGDLPGAVLAGVSGAGLPGPVDAWMQLDADGRFTAGAEPGSPAAHPPEGP